MASDEDVVTDHLNRLDCCVRSANPVAERPPLSALKDRHIVSVRKLKRSTRDQSSSCIERQGANGSVEASASLRPRSVLETCNVERRNLVDSSEVAANTNSI